MQSSTLCYFFSKPLLRKEQILHKALKLFNEKGYVDVGVREIARDLDISPGNLSYHFSKKEDILIALLEQYRETNTSLYEDYFSQPAALEGFLVLMTKVFTSQYHYRGVFIGNQYVQAYIESGDRFDYGETYTRRVKGFAKIFTGLRDAGQIKADEDDISFLVSHIALVGRFWIYEATLFNKSPKKQEVISHYISMLAKQLSLFATRKGLDSIHRFFEKKSPEK